MRQDALKAIEELVRTRGLFCLGNLSFVKSFADFHTISVNQRVQPTRAISTTKSLLRHLWTVVSLIMSCNLIPSLAELVAAVLFHRMLAVMTLAN